MRVAHVSRDDFVNHLFNYQPGEHVNVIVPTGGGKTHLMSQLAQVSLKRFPYLDYVHFMAKPDDAATSRWSAELELKETEGWPPPKKFLEKGPHRVVLHPRHIKDDAAASNAHLGFVFQKALNDLYWNGNSITFVDDAYEFAAAYGLNNELNRHWTMGRSNNSGLWTALQKPSGTLQGGVSTFAYSAPTHMFFGKDNTKANLERIRDMSISELNPDEIIPIIRNLRVVKYGNSTISEMLYVNRSGPSYAIVGI